MAARDLVVYSCKPNNWEDSQQTGMAHKEKSTELLDVQKYRLKTYTVQ